MHSLDRILEASNEVPHLGAESEGSIIDFETFETHHEIDGEQPTEAIKRWLKKNLPPEAYRDIGPYVTPDVPETTIEVNPPPLRSPRSTAAAQRLFTIFVDAVQQILGQATDRRIQSIHGVSLRPPNITAADASRHVDPFKRLYYEFQIARNGDKVGAAMGDHYNLSAPWRTFERPEDESEFYIRLAGRMRLMAAALTMGLATASPLYFASRNGHFGTILTGSNSSRLTDVWPGRTVMDIAGLFGSRPQFISELDQYLTAGLLYTGRDLWLPVRPQAGTLPSIRSFQEVCADCGLNIAESEEDRQRAYRVLVENFTKKEPNPTLLAPIRNWRVHMVEQFIRAPRNRVEIRVAETPPSFEDQTPYEYIKAVHTFLELYFIYLSENPEKTWNLTYSSRELKAAEHNEQAILKQGLDAKTHWPHNLRETTGREMLRDILDDPEFQTLARLLDREQDLHLIREIAFVNTPPPAERMRREIAAEYGIDARQSGISRFLDNDNGNDPDRYPKEVLRRTREAMAKELQQIEDDLPTLPAPDKAYLGPILEQVKRLRTDANAPAAQAQVPAAAAAVAHS